MKASGCDVQSVPSGYYCRLTAGHDGPHWYRAGKLEVEAAPESHGMGRDAWGGFEPNLPGRGQPQQAPSAPPDAPAEQQKPPRLDDSPLHAAAESLRLKAKVYDFGRAIKEAWDRTGVPLEQRKVRADGAQFSALALAKALELSQPSDPPAQHAEEER